MEITTKIRKDLLLLECYARPNNPRQAGWKPDEGDIELSKVNQKQFPTNSYKQPKFHQKVVWEKRKRFPPF